jgi:outer membrane protein assembly factor BamA
MGTGLIIFLWSAIMQGALAGGVPWYVGQPVAQVALEATMGGLPSDNLEPLLRTQAGVPLDLGSIRADVALLVAAGGFSSVDAVVEPWVLTDSEGNPMSGVRVIYQVISAPKLRALKITGVRGRAREVAESGLDLDLGDAWYGNDAAEATEARIQEQLARAGWTSAKADIQVSLMEGDARLNLHVELGEPERVGSMRFGGKLPVSRAVLKRWLRVEGLHEGVRFDMANGETARLALVERLQNMGWSRVRVSLFVQDRSVANDLGVSILVSAGPRLTIEASGRGLPNERLLRDTMGLRAGDSITDNLLEDAAGRLRDWYADQGFRQAEVSVVLVSDDHSDTRLRVKGKPGPRHWLRGVSWPESAPLSKQEGVDIIRTATDGSLADQIVSDDGIARAKRAIQKHLVSVGYLDASVSLEEQRGGPGLVDLPFRFGIPVRIQVLIDPGPQIQLVGLSVLGGNGVGDDLVQRWEEDHLNRPLRAARVLELDQAIVSAYEARGFLDVSTEVRNIRQRTKDTATIDVRVVPGEPIHLRSVVVRGNRRTRRHVVAREVLLKPGDPVSPDAIANTRSNLYNLDLFRLVSPELVGDEANARDLLLRVEERSNILLEAGGGISTDQGVKATGRAAHRNIWGLGHRLTGLGSVGYGWDGDEWRLDTGTPVWRAAARYDIPYVPGRGGHLVTEALINEAIQGPAWRLSRSGGSVGMKMRISDRSEAVVDYRVQVRRLVDVDVGALVNGDPWVPYLGLSEDLAGDPIVTSQPRVVSGGSFLLVHDKRNDRFNPTSGVLWSTQIEVGDGAFTGDVTMRASGKTERLLMLGPTVLNLVGRGGFGFAQGRNMTLPLEERFFLGGGSSMRGFATDSVGPANFSRRPDIDHPSQTEPVVDALALPADPGQWIPTGGDAMVSATVELRVPLPVIGFQSMDGTALVLFTDVGNVGFIEPTVVTTSRLAGKDPLVRTSFGVGLRIATPVGPASFDIGFNPSPITERGEAWVLPHLSLGVL